MDEFLNMNSARMAVVDMSSSEQRDLLAHLWCENKRIKQILYEFICHGILHPDDADYLKGKRGDDLF